MTTWRCPVCHGDLDLAGGGRTWGCASGHVYDVAREGYTNLLITHQRRQREPGDSPAMVRDRRDFLDRGFFEPLHAALQDFAPRADESACDAGCGEGYYTRGWRSLFAIDIAKPAVRAAAKRGQPGGRYAVASAYDLPLGDASVDVLVSVFAPLAADEFARVVRPGGRVVVVTPGPDHLAGLAAELFPVVEPHPAEGPFDAAAGAGSVALRRDPSRSGRIRFDAHIRGEGAVASLLGMTPWAWYVDAPTRARVGALPSLSTPIDFLISTYLR